MEIKLLKYTVVSIHKLLRIFLRSLLSHSSSNGSKPLLPYSMQPLTCSLLSLDWPEDWGSKIYRNVGNKLPTHTVICQNKSPHKFSCSSEDWGSKIYRNVGNKLPTHTVIFQNKSPHKFSCSPEDWGSKIYRNVGNKLPTHTVICQNKSPHKFSCSFSHCFHAKRASIDNVVSVWRCRAVYKTTVHK